MYVESFWPVQTVCVEAEREIKTGVHGSQRLESLAEVESEGDITAHVRVHM